MGLSAPKCGSLWASCASRVGRVAAYHYGDGADRHQHCKVAAVARDSIVRELAPEEAEPKGAAYTTVDRETVGVLRHFVFLKGAEHGTRANHHPLVGRLPHRRQRLTDFRFLVGPKGRHSIHGIFWLHFPALSAPSYWTQAEERGCAVGSYPLPFTLPLRLLGSVSVPNRHS